MQLSFTKPTPLNNTYILGFAAAGLFGFIYAIRNHYKRLQAKYISNNQTNNLNNQSTELSYLKKESEIVDNNNNTGNTNNTCKKLPIPEDLLERIVEKIKNSIIHTVCIKIDFINTQERIKKEMISKVENENSEIEESKNNSEEIKSNNNEVAETDGIAVEEENPVDTNQNPHHNNKNNTSEIDIGPYDKDMEDFIANLETKTIFLDNFERKLFTYDKNRIREVNNSTSRK